jgi:hypothetical protein
LQHESSSKGHKRSMAYSIQSMSNLGNEGRGDSVNSVIDKSLLNSSLDIMPDVIVLDEESCTFVSRGVDRAGRRIIQDNLVMERVVLRGVDLNRSNRMPSGIRTKNDEGQDHWK